MLCAACLVRLLDAAASQQFPAANCRRSTHCWRPSDSPPPLQHFDWCVAAPGALSSVGETIRIKRASLVHRERGLATAAAAGGMADGAAAAGGDTAAAAAAAAADGLKAQGNAEYKGGSYLKAAALYTQAIKADPEHASVLYRCAVQLRALRLPSAIAAATSCSNAKSPTSPLDSAHSYPPPPPPRLPAATVARRCCS